MPRGKKGRGGRQSNNSNNKKKNNKKGRAANGRHSTKQAVTNRRTVTPSSPGSFLQGQRPSKFDEYNERHKSILDNYETFYSRYKKATNRFCQYMITNTPEYVEGNRNNVNFLIIATDWMVENSFVVHPLVMKDLKLAIRLRSRASKSIYGGGDSGHSYFVMVLTYCWTHLHSMSTTSDQTQTAEVIAEEENRNRYDILMMDDDDDELDEEIFPSTPLPRPEPQSDIPLTIEQLMRADDRNDAVLFLLTLDDLMSSVSLQYECLSKNFIKNKSRHPPLNPSSIMEETLEAATATNMAIQQVQQLEMELQQQHPHLTTPYRLLSALVMPEITHKVSQIVREHGEEPQSGLEREIAIFLGDCIECQMRSRSDSFNQRETIVREFCSKFNVNETGSTDIDNIFHAIERLIICEMPLKAERQSRSQMMRDAQAIAGGILPKEYSWIRQEFIGGRRAIQHTLRLLQAFSTVIATNDDNKKIEAIPGLFGPTPWRPGRTKSIHGDLDELFMADILPQWVLMCKHGIWGKAKLPAEADLCPLFVLFRQFVETPGSPVTWSLTFAVHAMLTSVLETDKVFNELLYVNETVFNKYFERLDSACNFSKKEPEMQNNKTWRHNFAMVTFLQNLGLDVFGKHALWNPLCAGSIFSYLCYFGNMEGGCALVDCQGQLRITLHLFHALKVNGILNEGDIPFLDILYNSFKSSKGVWEGSVPRKGEFVKWFWIVFGMSATDANKMSQKAKLAVESRQLDSSNDKSMWKRRKMKPIEPSEISTSFRRICKRDFKDVEDKYHSEEQRRRSKGTDNYLYAVRSNDTMDAIDNEQQVLSLNLPSCGVFIEQFVCSLGRVLQWEPLLNAANGAPDGNIRQGYAVLFAQHLLGALDFSPDPFSYNFLNVPMGQASSTFMTGYFNRIDPGNLVWFQACESDSPTIVKHTI